MKNRTEQLHTCVADYRPGTGVRPSTGYRPGSALKQQICRPLTQASPPARPLSGTPSSSPVRPASSIGRPTSGLGRPFSARPGSTGSVRSNSTAGEWNVTPGRQLVVTAFCMGTVPMQKLTIFAKEKCSFFCVKKICMLSVHFPSKKTETKQKQNKKTSFRTSCVPERHTDLNKPGALRWNPDDRILLCS